MGANFVGEATRHPQGSSGRRNEGYDAIPDDVQARIAEAAAQFYGAGYVRGVRDRQ